MPAMSHAQFYVAVLAKFISTYRIPDMVDIIEEEEQLLEYLHENYAIKPEMEDDGQSMQDALHQVQLVFQGLIQRMGEKAGLAVKFMD